MNWFDNDFKFVWSMITWNHTLELKYENLTGLPEIARVQCVRAMACDRIVSMQNCIKTKHKNRSVDKEFEEHFTSCLRGTNQRLSWFFHKAIEIWKNNTKFMYLFSHPYRHLCGIVSLEQEDNLFAVICIAWNVDYFVGGFLY